MGDLAAQLRRLPLEIWTIIVQFAGVPACAAMRDMYALKHALRDYHRAGYRPQGAKKAMTDACLLNKWRAGVQALVDSGIYSVFTHARPREQLVGLVLSIDSLRLGIARSSIDSAAVAILVYNILAADPHADYRLAWWALSSPRTITAVVEELAWRGGSLAELRAFRDRLQLPGDDSSLARTFARVAAQAGRLDLLQDLYKLEPDVIQDQAVILVAAAKHNHLHIIRFLDERLRCKLYALALSTALEARAFDAAKWLYAKEPRMIPSDSLVALLKHGDVDLLQHFSARDALRRPDIAKYMSITAKAGQLQAMQWLCKELGHECPEDAFRFAAMNGHLDLLQWMQTHTSPVRWAASLRGAAKGGHLELVQQLHAQTRHCRKWETIANSITEAVKADHLHVAQWLAAQGEFADLRDRLCMPNFLAEQGRLDALRWIKSAFNVWPPSSLLSSAAYSGNMELMCWLWQTWPKLNELQFALDVAVQREDMTLLKWILQHLDPGHDMTSSLTRAAQAGRLKLVCWIKEHTTHSRSPVAMDVAAKCGALDVLQYLHDNGPWPCSTRAMDDAAAHGHLDAVKWLHRNRTEGCTTEAMDKAAARGDVEMVRFLHENRSEGCTVAALERAATGGHTLVVQYLLEYRQERCRNSWVSVVACSGSLSALKMLHRYQPDSFPPSIMVDAGRVGNLLVVKWLHEHSIGDLPTPQVLQKMSSNIRAYFEQGN
ncbi:hypothetical protein RI367_000515 [Sorochytrium milnesiophthora]